MLYKRSSVLRTALLLFAVILVAGQVLYSCRNPANQTVAGKLDGRLLAQKYCASCHMMPEPMLADKKSWKEGILPAMAAQLRLQNYMGQVFAEKSSMLSTAEWQTIENWYVSSAPDSLIIKQPATPPAQDWAGFSLVRPDYEKTEAPAMTTMVAVSPVDKQLYTGDAANGLYKWSAGLKATKLFTFDSPVTGVEFVKRGSNDVGVFTTIGQMMPVDVSKGKIQEITLNNTGQKQQAVTITDSLPRPVQTVTADFNKDGLADYVVCGFGHDRGALYYVEQKQGGKYTRKIMLGQPGGTQLIKGDFNNDGWTDVMCLFSQADESIWMFLNDTKGGFNGKRIMRFPPIYGSSSFQLADFNKDGLPDILYSCGDNSDYSKVLKPYHGVYIFTNKGNWTFKQSYFYRIDGATKAMAADFDNDGDLDIAAIAFFTDFKSHPEEGFTYLQNAGPGFKFIPHNIPVQNYGRWISMDVNDVDGDGAADIVLGNFSIGQRGLLNQKGVMPKWDMFEPIIMLKNMNKTIAKRK